MSKLRSELLSIVAQKMHVVAIDQKRPYTHVKALLHAGNKTFEGQGFSKVNWPDQWDESWGESLANAKAASDIVKQLLGREDFDQIMQQIGI